MVVCYTLKDGYLDIDYLDIDKNRLQCIFGDVEKRELRRNIENLFRYTCRCDMCKLFIYKDCGSHIYINLLICFNENKNPSLLNSQGQFEFCDLFIKHLEDALVNFLKCNLQKCKEIIKELYGRNNKKNSWFKELFNKSSYIEIDNEVEEVEEACVLLDRVNPYCKYYEHAIVYKKAMVLEGEFNSVRMEALSFIGERVKMLRREVNKKDARDIDIYLLVSLMNVDNNLLQSYMNNMDLQKINELMRKPSMDAYNRCSNDICYATRLINYMQAPYKCITFYKNANEMQNNEIAIRLTIKVSPEYNVDDLAHHDYAYFIANSFYEVTQLPVEYVCRIPANKISSCVFSNMVLHHEVDNLECDASKYLYGVFWHRINYYELIDKKCIEKIKRENEGVFEIYKNYNFDCKMPNEVFCLRI